MNAILSVLLFKGIVAWNIFIPEYAPNHEQFCGSKVKFSGWTLWIVNISQTKLLKLPSVHEYIHQMQTYCERKTIMGLYL